MSNRPVIDAVTGQPFVDPTSGRPELVNDDGTGCCCTPTACFATPCIAVSVSAISYCHGGVFDSDFSCITVPDFSGGGPYILPLIGSTPDGSACVWGACFSGIGADVKCETPHFMEDCGDGTPGFCCDGTGTITPGCNVFGISIGWSRDPGINPLTGIPYPPFSIDMGTGGPGGCANLSGACVWGYFGFRFDGPLADGMVLTLPSANPTCDPTILSPRRGGTVTIHLPKPDGTCDGTTGVPCDDCNCNPITSPCPTCLDNEPISNCGALPAQIAFDLSTLSFCAATPGNTNNCPLGVITLDLDVSGGDPSCASPPVQYGGQITDGGGAVCILAQLLWNGISWQATFQYFDSGGFGHLLFTGYLAAGATGPLGTYTISCAGACNASNGGVCTLDATAPGCATCQDPAITFPATRTVVISGCPTTVWNGTWTLDNCASPAGCGYRQNAAMNAAAGNFYLALGVPGTGIGGLGCGSNDPTSVWWVLSALPGTNPNVQLTGGDLCSPVGATITLGDGTTITVVA